MVDDLRIVPERDESRAMPKSNRPAATGASTKARSNATKQPVQKASGGSSVLVGLLCIMVALVSGAAAYLYMQTQTLSEQRDDLDSRVKVLEQKLSVTDESLSQSGAAIQSVLKDQAEEMELHMSEIRKLWGVAYDTNRIDIEALEKTTASQTTSVNSLRESVTKLEPLADSFASSQSRIEALANQSLALSAGFDETEGQLRELSDGLAVLRGEISAQKNVSSNHTEAIEAIDQYRVQINQRLIQLENQIRNNP